MTDINILGLENLRRKTAMVLHQIEISLGNFILNQNDYLIENAINNQNNNVIQITTKDFIENSYLDDLFQILEKASVGKSFEKDIKELRSLFIVNKIFHIRNVIAHPNRPFLACYWYQVATIASNPIIEIIGLDGVTDILVAAENNLITDPPSEWLSEIFRKITNNLPSIFEHQITGLIGRHDVVSQLKKTLISKLDRRTLTISLVAPGGSGKTAIILETLRRLVDDPVSLELFDACFYVTLKVEELTDEGIKTLNASTSVAQLKIELLETFNKFLNFEATSFDEVVTLYENKNILICIDNLETLLTKNYDEFDNFLSSIPVSWKVVITSRITISNSKNIPLNPLKVNDAIQIAKLYLIRKNGNNNHSITDEKIKKIVETCHLNPLAIRLTLDLYLKGGNIDNAASIANREITQFSFRNLIECLTKNSIKILECIYLKPECTRLDLKDILNLNEDEVIEAIGQLSNTSLISRVTSKEIESFKLGESISHLLLTNPRNIELRGNILKEIGKRTHKINMQSMSQRKLGIKENSIDYINENLPENLRLLLLEINNKIKNKTSLHNLYTLCIENNIDYSQNAEFRIAFGRVLNELKSFDKAIIEFQRAIEINNSIIAQYFIALTYFLQANYYDSANQFMKIKDSYSIEQLGTELYELIEDYMFRSLLFSNNTEEILNRTEKWHKSQCRSIEGSARARAIKNNGESINDAEKRIEQLIRSLTILEDVVKHDGYVKCACIQIQNIANEIAMLLLKESFKSQKSSINLINFIIKHVPQTTEQVGYENSEYFLRFVEYYNTSNSIDIQNPFKKPYWTDFLARFQNSYIPDVSSLITDQHVEVIVEKVIVDPTTRQRLKYLFAKDDNGIRYFVHYNSRSSDISIYQWRKLAEGSKLSLLPDLQNLKEGRDIVAKGFYLLEV